MMDFSDPSASGQISRVQGLMTLGASTLQYLPQLSYQSVFCDALINVFSLLVQAP